MYTLDNAIELNRAFPNSFAMPPNEKITNLKNGNIVKLIFREDIGVERLWVQISKTPMKKNDIFYFVGVLDNEPYQLETVKCGDRIEFTQEHIIDIFEQHKH